MCKFNTLKNIAPKKSKDIQTSKVLYTLSAEQKEKLKDRVTENVTFSFEIFDRTHKYFNLGELEKVCDSWFIKLFDVLNHISKISWNKFKTTERGIYDPHQYSNNVNEKFWLDEQYKENAWQFRLDKSHGRVHGILIGNIFYICLLDPHHNMYNSKGYAKARPLKKPKECFELRREAEKNISKEREELREIQKIYQDKINLAEDLENILTKYNIKNLNELEKKLTIDY